MWLYVWLTLVFIGGASVGSFLNVAIARLPRRQSLFFPASHCGSCGTSVAWYHNIPLVSYWWLRGRCGHCGAVFSLRYFLVELGTTVGFLALFVLDMVFNIHHWHHPEGGWGLEYGYYPLSWCAGFLCDALLFSLLLTAGMCFLDARRGGRLSPASQQATGPESGGAVVSHFAVSIVTGGAWSCTEAGLTDATDAGKYSWTMAGLQCELDGRTSCTEPGAVAAAAHGAAARSCPETSGAADRR
jgi:hypothetical protein